MNRARKAASLIFLLAAVAALTPAARPAPPADAAPPATPTADSGVLTLTLDDAVRLVLERNLDIARAAEFRNYVRGRYVLERAAALPHLTLAADETKSDDETMALFGGGVFPFPTRQTTEEVTVGLSQALFTWGQVGAAIRGAKAGIASAEDQLRLYQQAAVRDVTAAFDDVLLAKELAAIANLNLDLKQRHLDEAKRKLAVGTATDYDVLAAEVDVQNARPAVIRSETLIQSARDRLRFLLAIRGREVDVAGQLDAKPGPAPGYEHSLETALAHRPDLAQQQHVSDIYKEVVKISGAGDKPRLDFRGAYGWKDWELGGASTDGKVWSAGVYFSFPFFDGMKTRGQVIQAKSDYSTQRIIEAKLKDAISLEVRDALNALNVSAEILSALSGTVTQAERLLSMAEKGFALGVKTRLDVDDAQLNLLQAKGNLARAQRDYLVAEVTYQYVTGTLLP